MCRLSRQTCHIIIVYQYDVNIETQVKSVTYLFTLTY